MIDKEKFHVLNYVKKEEYCASMDGMRYMLKKKDSGDEPKLEVICIYTGRGRGGSGLVKYPVSGAKTTLGIVKKDVNIFTFMLKL